MFSFSVLFDKLSCSLSLISDISFSNFVTVFLYCLRSLRIFHIDSHNMAAPNKKPIPSAPKAMIYNGNSIADVFGFNTTDIGSGLETANIKHPTIIGKAISHFINPIKTSVS